MEIDALKEKARQVRRDIVQMVYDAKCGHPGGSLSAVELLCSLYYNAATVNPKNPKDESRDRIIYSKGHACPALYAILGDLGFFPKSEFKKFRKLGGLLQGHSDIAVPGVEMSAGSLGMGLSFAHGMALARDIDRKNHYVYAFLGDGECQEGQVWEAAMTAGSMKTRNFIAIIDRNQIQNDDFVKKTKDLSPLVEKWKAFNWHTIKVEDGHDFEEILSALEDAKKLDGPVAIIANTRKGYGVSFMELNPKFHGMAPSDEEFKKAMEELK